ncbi:chromophore lyase CpcT/CpeT [Candidatus Fermentibacteria bacterium]|nr:chromophore lyase CpcT/CpeT [Candidatus Fermentibacteria bacterium]
MSRAGWTVSLLCMACALAGAAGESSDDDLRTLASWMCGSFSSAQQAQDDSGFMDIRLRMVRVWPERHDGYWLYVEQATAWSQDEPYRQRVYHLTHVGADLFQSQVFELADPHRFIGIWRTRDPLTGLSPDSLEARPGCAILLRKHNDVFTGSTLGRLCKSSLRGAAFATSEVEVSATSLMSWDRGFSSTGEQVWGSEMGGYVFRRNGDFPLEHAGCP